VFTSGSSASLSNTTLAHDGHPVVRAPKGIT
jgi:hypothetical protein